ncbi:MAG: MFS transporter, partial [Candidatus Promineifilaceae bacterium]|nr:MFS transporter [Candidatus Promineifilaceae bacterium]
WLNIGMMSACSCAISAVALLGSGATSSWGLLVLLSLLTGIGAGMIESSINTYAATRFSPRAMNWLHACFGIGATLGLVLMTALVAGNYEWQMGFIIIGLIELLLALGFGFTCKYWRRPAPTETQSSRRHSTPLLLTLQLPVAWLGILLFAVFTGAQVSAGQWFYSLLTEHRGVSAALAGTWVSIFWASLTVGRIVFGFVVQRIAPIYILRICIGGVMISTIMLYLNTTPSLNFASIALLGLAMAPLFPLLTSATPQYLGRQHAANGVGLQVAAAGLGGVFVTSLLGVLAQTLGLGVIAPSLVVSALIMVLLFGLLARHVTI